MKFHPVKLKFGLLCTILVAMGCFLEGGYAFGVGGHGTSMPFEGKEAADTNASTMGYLTSTQALADYATIIVDLKKTLKAEKCPVVVFGASYGGMLTAWFRLKYPHLSIGALASSAPILNLDDIAPTYSFGSIITKDFRMCNAINSLPGEADTVSRIAAVANYMSQNQCTDGFGRLTNLTATPNPRYCTEMMFPISNPPGTMIRPSSFDFKSYSRECYHRYGVLLRQHWLTTDFGVNEMKTALMDFGSNIIFSNGLRDPWSSGGVLANISESIVAINTEEGESLQNAFFSALTIKQK
ncbi:uncharacterized protein LOC131072653 [Cryptomeria japonica]|uniref:uncharacterized protein LOC131072653 n=1 Tax=Cryptomeria japonica TaxID=3369 RepID=UPI0025ABD3E6|nr:uncharacterized protein LOC131072653 [Cryptomeria japonica]